MNKRMKEFCAAMVVIVLAFAAFFLWEASWQTPNDVRHYDEEPYYLTTPTEVVKGEMWTTPTYVPNTPTPSETPQKATEAPSPTEVVNSPTTTVTPTNTPVPVAQGVVGEKYCEVNGMHGWKPWAWYTAITVVNSPQYRLQQIAKTDSNGVRIARDPNGEWRYCVALPVYWAGGTSKDIGRCVDIYMENGAVLKCVLGDTKKVEHSLRGEGKYGRKGDVIEVQCDGNLLPAMVKQMGNASYLGDEWRGEVTKIVVLDMFIEGVQE